MKILLMGPQGCGKGTVGEMLAEHLKLLLVVLGQVFRDISKEDPNYEIINVAMEAGELVPLEIASATVKARLEQPDCAEGFILDGWCRRMPDLGAYEPPLDIVLNINISRETSIKRISGRRTCTSNGKMYNIYTLPKEMLAECTGELIQRADDTEEAVKTRLEIYYTQTQEVLDYFAKKGILRVIDGEGTPQEVFDLALEAINKK
jgi:adenylate kinase